MTGNRRFLFPALLLAALIGAGTAHAGFQWTAPSTAGAGPAPAAPSQPAAPVMSERLPSSLGDVQAGGAIATRPDGPASAAPIYGNGMTDDPITWNKPASAPRAPAAATAQPVYQTPTSMQGQLDSRPQAPAADTSLYALDTPAPAAADPRTDSYDIADGFGRDLPLVMAIRQIVPARYGFVFDDGIDLSAHVSWQGGKPWDQVLADTLAPLGLYPDIHGSVVSIIRGGAGTPRPQASAAPGSNAAYADSASLTTQTVQTGVSATMAPTPVAMQGPAITDSPAAQRDLASDLAARTTWSAPRGSTLRSILENWSERAGVELYWASEYDYPIQSAVKIDGTFEEAVQMLLKGLFDSRPRPTGRLHPNLPDGPAVLVIETRQNSL